MPIRPPRGLRAVILVGGLLAAGGSALADTDPFDNEPGDEREEARRELTADIQKTESLLNLVRRGKNLSDMTVGMFVMHVLNEMTRDDADLSRFIHRGDRTTQAYLEEVFRDHSENEVAAVEAMAGSSFHRRSAACALETLRHIPNIREPFSAQERDRTDMAAALACLDRALKGAVEEIPR